MALTQSFTFPKADVVVIGGGLIGLACANVLAQRGMLVELWERNDQLGGLTGAASAASAGMLAPLAEMPDDSEFLAVCLQARDLWRQVAPELEAGTGIDLDYDDSGALIAEQPGHPVAAFEAAARLAGEPVRRVDGAEARRSIPDLDDQTGPFLELAGDHRIDNRQVIAALAACLETNRVRVRVGRRVDKVTSTGNSAIVHAGLETIEVNMVLVTAGAWSGQISGVPDLPIHPVKGQMMRFEGVDWPFQGSFRAGHFYAVRRRRGGLLLGATMEPEAGFDASATDEGRESLLAFARRTLPGLVQRPVVESWAGLRPGSPDGRPLIGQVDKRIWVASGHYRNGVLLTPWTANFLLDWLDRGSPPAPRAAELFAPLRNGEPKTTQGGVADENEC